MLSVLFLLFVGSSAVWPRDFSITDFEFDYASFNYKPWECDEKSSQCHIHCKKDYIMPTNIKVRWANENGVIEPDKYVIQETDSDLAINLTLVDINDGSVDNSTWNLWHLRGDANYPNTQYTSDKWNERVVQGKWFKRRSERIEKSFAKCLLKKKCKEKKFSGTSTTCKANSLKCEYECDDPHYFNKAKFGGVLTGGQAFCDVRNGSWARAYAKYADSKPVDKETYYPALVCAEMKYNCLTPGYNEEGDDFHVEMLNRSSVKGCNGNYTYDTSVKYIQKLMKQQKSAAVGDKFCKFECYNSYVPTDACPLQNFTCVQDELTEVEGQKKMTWRWKGQEKDCVPECKYKSDPFIPADWGITIPTWLIVLAVIFWVMFCGGLAFGLYKKCAQNNEPVGYHTMNN